MVPISTSIINIVMEKELKLTKNPKTDVNPKGAGRPKGSVAKITVASLLEKADRMGTPFEEALLLDWATAPAGSELRYKYNQLLFNKVVADRHHVEIDETSTVANRQQAFLKALEVIGGVATVPAPKPLDYEND